MIGNKWVTYLELLHDGHSESESFAELGLKRYCASPATPASCGRPHLVVLGPQCAPRPRVGIRITLSGHDPLLY